MRSPAVGRREGDVLIPDEVIEQVRDRIDVVAVIGRHMELKRSGRTWKGCCVFHGEKTPSFHVYPEDKHFKCYGCGEYGDVFKFLQKLQGKEFPEVVRELAAEVGVGIPEEGTDDSAEARARRRERNEVLGAMDAAARYWAARLASRFGGGARRYLEGRGVTEESVRRFRLGVAADGWNDLPRRLAEKGIAKAALQHAGLLVEKEGGGYDRFRNRLMFPIAAMDGQVIGFGGRALGEEKGAKYINTPETAVYKKSKVLYGLDLAREKIRKTRAAVLVEGYFDVIGLHQVGVENAVAVCGTALTPEHVELLQRCDCREVTILFDGDVAGLAAPAKAAQALFPSGLAGKVALLPSERGKTDPDDFARANGRAAVERLLAGAAPLSSFLVDRTIDRVTSGRGREASLEEKIAAVRELRPFVRMMPEGLARSVFEDAIAKRLDLDADALRQELSDERPRRPAPPPGPIAAPRPTAPPRSAAVAPGSARVKLVLAGTALDALALLAAFPALADAAAEEGLSTLLPDGPLAELARELLREEMGAEAFVARVASAVGPAGASRAKDLLGPARPRADEAERMLRRAIVKGKIEQVQDEQARLHALVARAGTPVAEDLRIRTETAYRRRADLDKRLRSLERGG